nr:DUF2281 domain-containing protein [Desulfobulbaceae bacterium]
MNTAEIIFNQCKTLPEPLAREVLDFVGYLKGKQEQGGINDLIMAQEGALSSIWDNAEDEAWNGMMFEPGSIVLIPFPFSDLKTRKKGLF